MAYSEALNDIITSFDTNSVFYKKNETSTSKEPIKFGNVFFDAMSDSSVQQDDSDTDDTVSAGAFSVGAAIEMLGTRSQIKEHAFSEELDSSLDFDEIEELDKIADDIAAENGVFAVYGTDEASDDMTDDFDFSVFDDIEEIG